MTLNPRVRQFFQASASIMVLLAAWQIASLFFPHYLFPPVQDVLARTVKILFNWPELLQVLETAGRIFAGLAGAFVLGSLIAIPIGRYPKIESYVNPFLIFLQGIPALSWVIVAIIWFHGTEFRIFFIMVITTLPAFTFQVLDSYRSMSTDLVEMTMSFTVEKGELVAVLGKTGCGKSTMFNLLAGLIEPTSGKVEVTGHDPFREFNFFRGKIGIVFQNDRLMPWRSALDNVVLGLEILD